MAAWRRLLCVAALAAGAAAGQEESDRGAAGPEGSSTPDEDARSTAIGASAQLSASARGGRELLLAAYLVRSGVWITAGGESTSGADVPERRGVVLGGELELGDDAAVQLEARVVPAQAQMSRTADIVVGVVAGYLLLTGLFVRCGIYKMVGVDTSVQEQPYSTTDDRSGL